MLLRRKRILYCSGIVLHQFSLFSFCRSYGMSCTTVSKYKLFLSKYWPWLNFATYSIVPLSVMIITSIAIIVRIVQSQAQRNKTLNKKDGDAAKTTSITLTLLCVCLMFVLTNGPITVDRWVRWVCGLKVMGVLRVICVDYLNPKLKNGDSLFELLHLLISKHYFRCLNAKYPPCFGPLSFSNRSTITIP